MKKKPQEIGTPVKKLIGKRIKEIREQAGLTQDEFAQELRVSRGAVGNWERGLGVKMTNVQAIASAFSCDVSLFFDETSSIDLKQTDRARPKVPHATAATGAVTPTESGACALNAQNIEVLIKEAFGICDRMDVKPTADTIAFLVSSLQQVK